MAETIDTLILDLLGRLQFRVRTYDETLDAWRTSCPRFPVWEDASDRGLVETTAEDGRSIVRVTPSGLALLTEQRPETTPRHPSLPPVRRRR
jgi:D-3-phosphoglycerate dehydrogenase